EGTGRDELVPVLADRDRGVCPRTRHRPIPPPTLTEGFHVPRANRRPAPRAGGPDLGVLMRAVAPQRALGAVPDLAAVADIEQAGHLVLAEPERAADAARPGVVRVLHGAQV